MLSSRHAGRFIVASLVVGAVPLWLAACGSSAGDGTGTGGATSTGGSSGSSGAATSGSGGQTTGGANTGGASTGGTSTGGAITGGSSSGGTSGATGGSDTGGSSGAGASSGTGGAGMGGANAGTGGASGGTGGANSGTGGASGGKGGTAGSGGGSCTTTTSLKSGDNNLMITVGGVQRSFIVHAPPSYNGTTRMPVVFDFHGLGGQASMERNFTGWARLGDTEGFITVFPQGLPDMAGGNPGWNAGGCCVTVADDVAFVRAMITHLETNACIDSKRIHATGCSNGGAMSYMLACNAADVIASVAPVDFDCVVGGRCMQCNPGRPITEVQFRATMDQAVNYSGAMPNFERWGQINMCTGAATPLSTNAACQTYPMCGGGEETILCTVQNGTHCANYSTFMIPQVAWEVLKRHPMP